MADNGGICLPCIAAAQSASAGKIAAVKALALAAAQREGKPKAYVTRNAGRPNGTGYGYSFTRPGDGFEIVEVILAS